jgi:predicted TIM-barrel fold metal-dependent hydrolase
MRVQIPPPDPASPADGMGAAYQPDELVCPGRRPKRTITLEEHFATPAFMQGPGKFAREVGKSLGNPELVDQLLDLGPRRIADMDSSGIDVQIVSLTAPGVEQLDPAEAASLAREASDLLAEVDRNLGLALTKLQRPLAAYLRENLHYTFSGFNFTPTFLGLLLEVGVDRIMFSADYPYASMDEARQFLDRLPVAPADRKRIAHGNAERLLGLGAP